jgi:glycosyltransferase involved in cell wall biosynthesis
MRLSVIVITRNEQANIGECLKSVDFADEIIVLDNASTDNTVEIARSLGAQVHVTTDWPGFGPQKNRALAMATGDWVLSIDADERVTPALRQEILRAIEDSSGVNCFAVSRSSSFCGRFIQHSGWSPDYVDRLFKNGTAFFSDDLVHERLVYESGKKRLSGLLLHFSFRDFSDVLRKVDQYSSASAQQAFNQGRRATVFTAVGHGFWAFLRVYLFKLGFLDGSHGLALAISTAEGSYYRYLKLWQLTYSVSSRSHK